MLDRSPAAVDQLSLPSSSAFLASNSACQDPLATRPCSFSSVATTSSALTAATAAAAREQRRGCRCSTRRHGPGHRTGHGLPDADTGPEAGADAGETARSFCAASGIALAVWYWV